MAKYHINKATGNVGACEASVKSCPHGEESDHFDSPEEARRAYEEKNLDRTLAVVVKRPARKNRRRSLDENTFVSVYTGADESDVLAENFPNGLRSVLEPGEYYGFYHDSSNSTDHKVKLIVGESGDIEYEPLSSFKPLTAPSSGKTQAAVQALRDDLKLLMDKSDPFYCKDNSIDRVTLLETSNELKRALVRFDWDTAVGATRGALYFEDLEWVIEKDLDLAKSLNKTEEINALTESKNLISSFMGKLSSRRV